MVHKHLSCSFEQSRNFQQFHHLFTMIRLYLYLKLFFTLNQSIQNNDWHITQFQRQKFESMPDTSSDCCNEFEKKSNQQHYYYSTKKFQRKRCQHATNILSSWNNISRICASNKIFDRNELFSIVLHDIEIQSMLSL